MPYVPFVGPSYSYRSLNFDAQRSINLFPVKSEAGDSRTIGLLLGRPGLSLVATLGGGNMRGGHACGGRCFVVCGSSFYEIYSNGSYQLYGTLKTYSGLASIADNGQQVCIVDGDYGYIFNLSSNTFTQITSGGFQGANTVTFIDGYFVFNKPNSQQYYISALYDGTIIDPLDFASAEGSPDNIVGLIAVHQNVWLFGEKSVQMVFDAGSADFPFQPVQGAFIQYGCASAGSIAKNTNTVFWLGADDEGAGIVWMGQGYNPQRISTQAIEYYLQQYKANFSTAKGYCYQEEGHYFYCLDIDGMPTTLVYDATMQQWHERAFFNTTTGQYQRHLPTFHVYAFGKHLVGDYSSGALYEQSLNYYSDNGNIIRYERTAPHLINNLDRVMYDSFQLDMEAGTGLDGSPAEEDINPTVSLQISNDGGHVWIPCSDRNSGAIGAYKTRVIWKRLGSARDRIFKTIVASRCKVAIFGAVVKMRGAKS